MGICSSRMLRLVLVGLVVSLPVMALSPAARAQSSEPPLAGPRYSLLHVNATAGSDSAGNGSQMRPYGTITHALQVAAPNTIIIVSAGEYSSASGESFPLRLKPGVTVQGEPGDPSGVVIRGGHSYLSPSQGLQNVAVLAADGAGLGNVTVVNPHPAGQGVWIESGSPVIRQSVLTGSGRAGVFVAGSGDAIIQGNRFFDNDGAGLIMAGPTTANILGNSFERNGTGIQVAAHGTPRIAQNRIVQNQSGLIVQANARPVLQSNWIAQNRRNGIVEFQVASESRTLSVLPEVVPFQTAVPSSEMPPVATPLTDSELSSLVAMPETEGVAATPTETNASVTNASVTNASVESSAPTTADQMAAFPATGEADTEVGVAALSVEPQTAPATTTAEDEAVLRDTPVAAEAVSGQEVPDREIVPDEATEVAETRPLTAGGDRSTGSNGLETADGLGGDVPQDVSEASETNRVASLRRWLAERSGSASGAETDATGGVELSVIPPPVDTLAFASQAAPESAPLHSPSADSVEAGSGPLQVPEASIPLGSSGVQTVVIGAQASGEGPPAPPSRASALGLRYRVLVEAPDEATQAALRTVVADAFRVQVDGQTLMQAGAYPDRETADALANRLQQQGFAAQVVDVP